MLKEIKKHTYSIITVAVLLIVLSIVYGKLLSIGIPDDYTFPWKNNVNYHKGN